MSVYFYLTMHNAADFSANFPNIWVKLPTEVTPELAQRNSPVTEVIQTNSKCVPKTTIFIYYIAFTTHLPSSYF